MVDLGLRGVTCPGKKKSFFARLFGEEFDLIDLTDEEMKAAEEAAELSQARARRIQEQMAVPSARDQYNNMMGQANAALANAGLLGGLGSMQGMQQAAGMNKPIQYSPMEKLLMRMNVPRNERHEFDFLEAVDNPTKDNVIVFLIVRGEPITLEDERAMFPSDGLVARINVLRK